MVVLLMQQSPVGARGGIVSALDSDVHEYFVDHRPDWVVDVATFLDQVGESQVLLVVAVVIAALWWVRLRPSMLPFTVPLSVAVNELVVVIIKDIVDRERPEQAQQLVEATSASLPSGHSASAAALATSIVLIRALAAQGPRRWVVLDATVMVFAMAAGLARLVLGVHWFSDVLVGWFIGFVVSVVIARAASKIPVCRPSTN